MIWSCDSYEKMVDGLNRQWIPMKRVIIHAILKYLKWLSMWGFSYIKLERKTAQKCYKPILVFLNTANVLTIMSVASRKDEIFK